jgi:HAD superfamily hydrolase (TIGR01549 family)
MAPIRPAVTFDLWHTLVYLEPEDEEEYMRGQIDEATRVLEQSDHLPGEPRPGVPEARAAFQLEYSRAVTAAGEGRSVPPVEQLTRAAAAMGRVARPDAYLDALRRLIAPLDFRLAPNAIEVLRELREAGYRVGMISNTVGEPGRFLHPMLTRLGFDEWVETYTFSDELPWTKPAPEIFRAALGALGGRSDAAIHVGDGWSDIEGARRAGMRSGILFTGLQRYGKRYRELFLAAGEDRPPAEFTVPTLPQIVPIVRRLLPSTLDQPSAG